MEHKPIPADRAEELRAEFIPSWEIVKGKMLQKRFMADDHNGALDFIEQCMEPSVKLDHFPDIAFFYNEVLVRIYHHDSGGLVDTCFILAKAIDKIAKEANLRYDLEEAMMDVALQGRGPVSPGSMGLMRSRADYGRKIADPSNIHLGAVDALQAAVESPVDVNEKIAEVAHIFKMGEGELCKIFERIKGKPVHAYHKQAMHDLKTKPKKI
jgi:pterin-4a-carbinolamine dehydratase